MDESHVWVQITTESTNLSFQAVVSLNGSKWDVRVTNNTVRATSRKTYPVPGTAFDERDKVIRSAMNQIVGHLRNLGYFAIGVDMKWGYEGGYTGTHYGEAGMFFPSIHQQSSSTYSDDVMKRAERIIKDIGSSRKKGLKTTLNYWRRAKELDSLGFDSEAFLNYFKILECLAELCADETTRQAIVNRFCPDGRPQATLCKKYRAKSKADQDNLRRQINFVAKALSAAGITDKISRGLFTTILDFVFMRHGWNVAHKLVRPNPYDEYGAIGQHSDEFSLVMIENLYINKVTKLMILLYVKPKCYEFHVLGGMPMVVPKSGKGSIKDGQ